MFQLTAQSSRGQLRPSPPPIASVAEETETIRAISDEACMLQLTSQSLHSKLHSSPPSPPPPLTKAADSTEFEPKNPQDIMDPEEAAVAENMAMSILGLDYAGMKPSLNLSAQETEYHLIPHYKTGFVMSLHAGSYVNSEPDLPYITFSGVTMGLALESSQMQTLKPSCFAQFARNPYELVVSGYLYAMASSEGWMLVPFGEALKADPDSCEVSFQFGQATMSPCQEAGYNEVRHQRSTANVFRSSLSGYFSTQLPDANANETYPDYLQRVDLDAGLIASFIQMKEDTWLSMGYVKDFLKNQSCAITTCFGDYYEDCNATWQRVTRSWQIPQPQRDAMVDAATRSCPGVDALEVSHSAHTGMETMNLTHPPEHEMVQRLRELDSFLLNGTIAALEEQIECPVSGKYKEPA